MAFDGWLLEVTPRASPSGDLVRLVGRLLRQGPIPEPPLRSTGAFTTGPVHLGTIPSAEVAFDAVAVPATPVHLELGALPDGRALTAELRVEPSSPAR